jgi:hypothetical protein
MISLVWIDLSVKITCYLLSATCAAMIFWRSTTRRQFGQWQSFQRQNRLCPLMVVDKTVWSYMLSLRTVVSPQIFFQNIWQKFWYCAIVVFIHLSRLINVLLDQCIFCILSLKHEYAVAFSKHEVLSAILLQRLLRSSVPEINIHVI